MDLSVFPIVPPVLPAWASAEDAFANAKCDRVSKAIPIDAYRLIPPPPTSVRYLIGQIDVLEGPEAARTRPFNSTRECAGRDQRVARPTVEDSEMGTVCGTTSWAGRSDGVTVAPARDTVAEVIMPSPLPRPGASSLRSDHRKKTLIARTAVAIITGTNSRRSCLAGIHLALHRWQRPSLPELVSKWLTRSKAQRRRRSRPRSRRLLTEANYLNWASCDRVSWDSARAAHCGQALSASRQARSWIGGGEQRDGFSHLPGQGIWGCRSRNSNPATGFDCGLSMFALPIETGKRT